MQRVQREGEIIVEEEREYVYIYLYISIYRYIRERERVYGERMQKKEKRLGEREYI